MLLGVVITDDLYCVKEVEQAKLVSLKNSTLHNTKLVLLIKNHCFIFSDYTQCSFMELKPDTLSLIKNTWETFQYLTIKISKVSVGENLTIGIMRTSKVTFFKHFFAKKQTQLTFRLFNSRNQCLSNHKFQFRCGYLFCKYIRKLFSDNYQIFDAFDNPKCALILRNGYVRRNEQRYPGYDTGWLSH